jgi:PAS domain S-box-containing protein
VQSSRLLSTTEQTRVAQALVAQLADALIFADRAGVIQVWNAGAEAVFGYGADEVLGRRLDLLIPERLRSAHWAAFDTAVDKGQMKHGRDSMTTRSVHKDGRHLYVDLSFALVKDEAGQVLGSVAIGRDITARFHAEKEARKRLAQLEAEAKGLQHES